MGTAVGLELFPKTSVQLNLFSKIPIAKYHIFNTLLRKTVSTGIKIDKMIIQNSYNVFSSMSDYNLITNNK